jgi:tetratricopeptide (TPR) repeat protein
LENTQGANLEAHVLLGQVYADQGDVTSAVNEYQTAIGRMGGVYPDAHFRYGQLLLERGDEAQAESQFQQAVEGSQRQHLPSLVALMELALRRNETSKADDIFHDVMSRAAETPEDLLQIGKASMLRGEYDYAARDLRRAMAARSEGNAEAELYLALTLARHAELNIARGTFEQAISRRSGNYPEARLEFGKFLHEQGEVSRAVSELRAAVRLRGGNYPRAELALGTVLADWAVNRCEEAVQQLTLAISHRDGVFPEVEQALWRVYVARLGLLDEARKLSARPEDQVWLEQGQDAFTLYGSDGNTGQRPVGEKPLENGDVRNFYVVPLATGAAYPAVALRTGSGGLNLRWRPGEQGHRPRWVVTVSAPDGERQLDVSPLDNHLMKKFATEMSVRVSQGYVAFWLDNQEVGRIPADQPVPIQWTVTDGGILVLNIRESKGMDNH